ncbi:MAG: P-loop NTPase [Thermoplasmata archaeon]
MTTIGVSGGKGGTGKSTVAVNLAYFLSRSHKVVLIDADVECPNDHILLSVKLETPKDVNIFKPVFDYKKCVKCKLCKDVCAENAIVTFKEGTPFLMPTLCSGCKSCILACPVAAILESSKHVGIVYTSNVNKNLTLVTGFLDEGEERAYPVALNAKVSGLDIEAEIYIIDTSAGSGSHVAIALEDVDIVALVTEPTLFGLHDLEMMLKLLVKQHRIGYVIVNRADLASVDLNSILKKYDALKIGALPINEKIVESYIKGIPFIKLYPDEDFSRELGHIAEMLLQKGGK